MSGVPGKKCAFHFQSSVIKRKIVIWEVMKVVVMVSFLGFFAVVDLLFVPNTMNVNS